MIKSIHKKICVLMLVILLSNCIPSYSEAQLRENVWERLKDTVVLKVGSSRAYIHNVESIIDTSNHQVVPIVKNGSTLVPVRFISESFGAKIDWDGSSSTVVITYKNKVAQLKIGSNQMRINNIEVPLDTPAESINDRVFIPLRRLAEDVLGKKVFYSNGIIILGEKDNIIDANSETDLLDKIAALFKSNEKLQYMIYYGSLDRSIIETAKSYRLVILHPQASNITRSQIKEIQEGINPDDPKDDVAVLGYISVGEDLRTCNLSDEQMLSDKRFTGNGTGPRVDPRGSNPNGSNSLLNIDPLGKQSSGGSGYASWYLDDNNSDGKPDRNKFFNGAFVNAGDPAWFDVVDKMKIDSADGIPGLAEILTMDYGRGFGCDGVFLDTVDTCAPNSYTDSSSPNQSEFEWTAPGFSKFIERLRKAYPEKFILQNRGVFFFDSRLPHYKFCTRQNLDFLLFESYRLNSNISEEYNDSFFRDNKHNFMPKIMAEANRPDGFRVLSLGYAEGPSQSKLKETLLGKSSEGLLSLITDITETQDIAGFNHYITDAGIMLVNDFVRNHSTLWDTTPPTWSSTYNSSRNWPPESPNPRVGLQQAVSQSKSVLLRWDVALDMNKVKYAAYYQMKPFDFDKDPKLASAIRITLLPEVGEGYEDGSGPHTYPYQAKVENLIPGQTYYFVLRAVDDSPAANEDGNKVVLSAAPTE